MITLKIQDYKITLKASVDFGTDQNCIQEGLIPTKYFEKTTKTLSGANGKRVNIKYKLSKVHICNKEFCFINTFLLVKDLRQELIWGTPFLTQFYPLEITEKSLISKRY